MDQKEYIKNYINNYEEKLMQHLQQLLKSHDLLDERLPESPDIDAKWEQIANSYIADAVKEIQNYPTVSLGWAMYVGMAVARYWDEDWQVYGNVPNLYEYIRDKRGFDYLDEVVRGDILMLKDDDYAHMEKVVQGCAQQALNKIRFEQVEPQSPLAFHIYARSITVLYKLGAAIELRALGYKMQKL